MRTIAGTTWSVEDAQDYVCERSAADANGCWVWRLARFTTGYGVARTPKSLPGHKLLSAHRLAYEAYVGPIPPKMAICHRCDVPACCNPAHLFLGTPADNSADMVAKSRQAHGSRHGGAKLADAQVIEIRARYACGGTSHRKLAKEFGVTHTMIGYILRRDNWTRTEEGQQ